MKRCVIKMLACVFCVFFALSVKSQEYTFKSYHIYTTDEDKYVLSNEQNDSSIICFSEDNQEILLKLYNRGVNKWMNFVLKINQKIDLGFKGKIGTLYLCANNANKTCGVCIVNTNEGIFIDLHDFYVGERTISCWMK